MYNFLLTTTKDELIKLIIDKLMISATVIILGFITIKVIMFLLKKLFDRTKLNETLEQFISSLTHWSLWIILLLILLNALGVDTTPIWASLSIAGFITGFALKDVLSNLTAGLLIIATKPFTVKDYIRSGDISGTIVKIGIASCVIKTADNVKITVPNEKLWSNPIINYSAYDTRRIDLKLGIDYKEDIGKVTKVLDELIKANKLLLDDPAPTIQVSNLGDYTVDFNVFVWVKRKDYADVKNDMLKTIKETFAKKRINMPNPMMDINLKKIP